MDSQVKSHDSRRVLWSRIPTQACEEPRDTAGLFLSQHERLFHHCADRLKGISFEPIVHVNVRLPTWLVSLSLHNHAPTRFTCFRRNRAATNSGFGRLPGNAICSLTGGIASHELKTCATQCRARQSKYSSRSQNLFRTSMA